jgi:hypothetical protein
MHPGARPCGPRRRALDEAGNADAAVNASFPQPRLLGAQLRVAHALHQHVKAARVRQTLQRDATGGDGGISLIGYDIAGDDLDRIDAERGRGAVDQMLPQRIADWMARSAILR